MLVFWDYPCLYQKGDTSTNGITLLQRDSFDRGLDSINILYGHVGTLSLLCTKHYADPTTRMPYKDSAWPYFEMLVSTLIKPADKAVNLPVALEWIGAKASDIASGLPKNQSNCSLYWLYQHARRRERRLPVPPEQFNEDIKGKKATNGSDIQILINKFRQTFDAVMAPAQQLQLSNVPGPNANEWHLFLTKTLRSCTQLVHVDLSRNEAIAGVTLEVFSHLNGTLEFLYLANCVGFGGSLQPLRRFLKLKCLYLPGCLSLEGSLEPLKGLQDLAALNVEACFGLVGGLEQLSSLPKLRTLNVCDTALAQAAFVERRRQALDAEVRKDGGALVVGGCRVGRYNEEVTPLWFAANDGQVQVARGLLAGRVAEAASKLTVQGQTVWARPSCRRRSRASSTWRSSSWTTGPTRISPESTAATPLLFAAQEGFVDIAKLLLAHRADVNRTDAKRQTPLNLASWKGHVDVVRLLLRQNADVTVEDQWGNDALASARQEGHGEVVQLLVEAQRRQE